MGAGYPGDYPKPWDYNGRTFEIVADDRVVEHVDRTPVPVDGATAIKALIAYAQDLDEARWYAILGDEA